MEYSHAIQSGRADFLFKHPLQQRDTFSDVTVANPFCDTYIRNAMRTPAATAMKRVADKNVEYGARCQAANINLLIWSFELFGGMADETLRALRTLANHMDRVEPYQPVNWAAPYRTVYLAQRIAMIIARHNTDTVVRRLRDLEHVALGVVRPPQDQASTDNPAPGPLPPVLIRGRGASGRSGRPRGRPRGSRAARP